MKVKVKIDKHQIVAIVLLFLIVPLGVYSKIYSGIGHEWVNNKLGGVFYEIFWCLVFFILLSRSKPIRIAFWVLIITCFLEFVQLLNNSWLVLIRSNFIGRTIIGNSFSWSDFPYYFMGSLLGYFILRAIKGCKLDSID